MRKDRKNILERQCTIECNYLSNAYGSCLITLGKTKVLCTCSVEAGVPPFKLGKNSGWLTAEYAMLPASTSTRKKRDGLKKDSRGVEIQRLIGRTLRQAINLDKIGEHTLTIDCDVLQADGGTRTASITGGYVALVLAVNRMLKDNLISENPLITQIAAISAGIVDNDILVDLCYQEDSRAESDINIVMNGEGDIVEIQGTAEKTPYSLEKLNEIIISARISILRLMVLQRNVLKQVGVSVLPKPILAVASGNKHKIEELNLLLNNKYNLFGLDFLNFKNDIVEDGTTFNENAQIKAKAISSAFLLPTIADDSGLCVDALNGEPGIYSARFGGENLSSEEKNNLLLSKLINANNRSAHFHCTIAYSEPSKETMFFTGQCLGSILHSPQGEHGFGYDPIFCYENGTPLALMTMDEKNKISHRGKATEAFSQYVERL